MNKRIQQHAEQAGVVFPYGGFPNYDQFDLERFTELIIRECCDVLYDNEMGGYQVNYVLKEHFGVEP